MVQDCYLKLHRRRADPQQNYAYRSVFAWSTREPRWDRSKVAAACCW